ncbi:MAG: hypothetical protein ACREXN_09440, partial [Polaromonas sp.]
WAFGFTAALDCVVCGFLDLAIGMRPPDVGNCFKYRSATSKQNCALRLTGVKARVTKIQSSKREG